MITFVTMLFSARYTGWPEVHQVNGKATTLIRICRNMFSQYGVPEEIASDGGPPFQSYEWKQFLKQWGIHQRISSANYPQSNGRAELAVKSCKRMLHENTGKSGCLDTTSVVKALLQYRNTPLSGIGMSPSYMLYGRQMRDALPSVPNKWRSTTMCYNEKYGGPISKVWEDIKICREIAAARKLQSSLENYDIHKRPLPCLSVGDYVAIQNRNGPNPLRWDKTGRIVERLANRQYMVKADGSGRVLLRTRCHLRKINSPSEDRSSYDLDKFVGIAPGKISNEPDIPLFVPGTLNLAIFMWKIENNKLPEHISSKFQRISHNHNTRQTRHSTIQIPSIRLNCSKRYTIYNGSHINYSQKNTGNILWIGLYEILRLSDLFLPVN